MVCAACGTPNTEGAQFCVGCSGPLIASVQNAFIQPLDPPTLARASSSSPAPSPRTGWIRLRGSAQPALRGFRVIAEEDDNMGETPVVREASWFVRYLQPGDRVEVLGKWKKKEYIRAVRLHNFVTEVEI